MKVEPGRLGWIFAQLVALKGRPVLVVDQAGSRYESSLQFAEEFVTHIEVVRDTPSGKQSVIAVGPLTRVLNVVEATILVDLSRMIAVYSDGPEGLQQQLFYESKVDQVKLHKAKALDSEADEKLPDEDTCEDGEYGRADRDSFERTHYLGPGEVIKRVCLTDDGINVWVDRRRAKKRRSS